MEITNFDHEASKRKTHHHWLLPSSIRCIICGPSGCGKTNLLLNLLPKKGYLEFDRLHLYSKSLAQEKCQCLCDWATMLKDIAGRQIASFLWSSDDIIPIERI